LPELAGTLDAGISEPAALAQCDGLSGGGDAAPGLLGTLVGTGYDGVAASTNDTVKAVDGSLYVYGGGSGWLTTTFDVTPKEELQLRIMIMDTFDGLKDSVVLVDNMGWSPVPTGAGVSRPE
jgi:hypothetical protein